MLAALDAPRWLAAAAVALTACGGGDSAMPAAEVPELTGGACSPAIAPGDPEGEVCRDYQDLLDALHFGFGETPFSEESVPDEPILDLARFDLAVVDSGWRPLRVDELDSALQIHLTASDESLARARKMVNATSATSVWLFANRNVRMASVASLRSALPGARWRLVVRKSHAAVAETFYAAYPRTPGWTRSLLTECLSRAPYGEAGDRARREVLRRALGRAAGRCNRVGKLFFLMDGGASLDVVGPAAVQMIRDCECQLTDLDGFVSALALLVLPLPDAAWIPLPVTLPMDGTVGDWARQR